ncbi:MAG: 5-(carboxyamino)imidazole ribonucleotide mutase [Clostridia bacterium]|nr:5-(carboxyamino)imidazole ribonucleotide mutase [Clostridia bacterium]
MNKVAVIMGSDKDLPIMEKAIEVLKQFEVPFEVHLYSPHRTCDKVITFAQGARAQGFGVIIAGAGKAAHLAGTLASNTTIPVIGVPISSGVMDGMDALLSTIMMPRGIPVATISIDGAENAALLAIQILAITDMTLQQKLELARDQYRMIVLAKDGSIGQKYNT